MPSFTFLGRFRVGQWKAFRRFMLEERRDAALRISVIQAELARIGRVAISFAYDESDEVTEKRLFLTVKPMGSSIGKLMQAYTGMGGNPYDISMFLTPNSVQLVDDGSGTGKEVLAFTQPSGGILYMKSGSLAYGSAVYEQGDSSLLKYSFKRVGGRRELANEADAMQISRGRRWIEKEIRFKRNALEERIIKLCDLREQLLEELDLITCAVAETIGLPTVFSTEGGADGPSYLRSSAAAAIAGRFDEIIWVVEDVDGVMVANLDEFNDEGLASHVNITSDAEGDEEAWTAL